MRIYFDFREWRIGYYRGITYHRISILPIIIGWDSKLKSKGVSIDSKFNEILTAAYEDRLKALVDKNYKYFETIYPKKDSKSVVFPIRGTNYFAQSSPSEDEDEPPVNPS